MYGEDCSDSIGMMVKEVNNNSRQLFITLGGLQCLGTIALKYCVIITAYVK